ncbi:polyadenylate-binding protein [Schizosaccharomyces japonicus yFS275]|uniref:Polyadenylate-binding protein n=1 Tax=Schizosaccharomyces japonicus (strain yFS275 / FY16936) TaxID=402676 RepID=B6K033_SCHJY|nr:polyadenylate-binding protein [Schizosaccharomyces japonicus yFS275]EEB06183.1 polyadenylate-binding protein [Schizosaccharomyces japonicus yFS275]
MSQVQQEEKVEVPAVPTEKEISSKNGAETTTASTVQKENNKENVTKESTETESKKETTQEKSSEASSGTPSDGNAPKNTSLYVGELDPSVTEAMLFEIFSTVGPVASIRVCRDAVTRQSLGYAYVNYHNADDGEKALEELNYSLIKGRACRIMWSQRDPSLRKTGTGNIFIKNLDPAIDNKALHDTFSAFGTILSCKVALDEYGNSKGYGFVHFASIDSANAAIEHVNGMLLNDKKVYVGHHVSRRDRQSKFEAMKANFTNVYIKNIDPEVTDEEFSGLFEKFGAITSFSLVKDESGKPRGFGFVNFESHEAAQKAVDEMNDYEFHGKKLYVGRAQKRHEREAELRKRYEQMKLEKMSKYQGVNLFIKNLSDEVDDNLLKTEFSAFGTITSAKVMTDENGKSKGFGFVCYSSPEEATKAIAEMNQRMLAGKPLYVALAQRKDVRRSQLEAQIQARNQFRMQQQVAAAGMSAQFGIPGAMYYGPGGYPLPAGARGVPMPHPNMMPPNGKWPVDGAAPQPGMVPVYPPGVAAPNFPGYPRPVVPSEQPAGQEASNGAVPVPAFDMNAFSAETPENQKQILGEYFYPLIAQREAELAGKITGMLLEMDNAELLGLVQDIEALNGKVDEALSVLKEFQETEGTADAAAADETAAAATAAAAETSAN